MFLKKTGAIVALALVFFFCSSYLAEKRVNFKKVLSTEKSSLAFRPLNLNQTDSRLDSIFTVLRRYRGFTGVVLMAEKGEVVHTGAYGYAHHRRKEAMDIHTSFQLASVSKPLTASLILKLHEEGKIQLDYPVQHYIKDFPYEEVTVRHLLNQRSGICRYMYLADKYWDQDRPLTNEDVLCLFQTYKPDLYFTPGRRFNYINTNYVFLALLAERITGKSFSQAIQEKVFGPLGMTESVAYSLAEDPEIDNEATGHRRGRRGYWAVRRDYLDGAVGDKGIYSSIRDLFLFDQALYGDQFLKKETIDEAFFPGSPELRTHNYGFGWRMKTAVPGMIYHFGWWRGFRTVFMRDIASQKTLIILSNSDHGRGLLGFWGWKRMIDGVEEEQVAKAKKLVKKATGLEQFTRGDTTATPKQDEGLVSKTIPTEDTSASEMESLEELLNNLDDLEEEEGFQESPDNEIINEIDLREPAKEKTPK